MKAAVLTEVGGHLQLEEIPRPSPKAGEVLVKVTACGVCHTDLHVIKGEVAFPAAMRAGTRDLRGRRDRGCRCADDAPGRGSRV